MAAEKPYQTEENLLKDRVRIILEGGAGNAAAADGKMGEHGMMAIVPVCVKQGIDLLIPNVKRMKPTQV